MVAEVMVTWRCPLCGHVERQPKVVKEIAHHCLKSKERGQMVSLEKVT